MKTFLSITFFALFTSCNSTKDSKPQPFRKSIVDSVVYERLQQERKILNYSSLENGVDSFEIRMWTSFGHIDINTVEILKYEDANWHFSQSRYWYSGDSSFPNRGSKIFLDSSRTEFAKLTMPIPKLVDSLIKLDLNIFPSQSQINGFTDNVADGMHYNLEIATKKYYKHLFYHEPEHYTDSLNKKFIRILNLLATKPSK